MTCLEECRFLLNTQLMFLMKEKDPTSKQFDDDGWIRSLTEAQEATTDVPEDCVTYDQQDVDPKRVRPIQVGEFLRKCVSRRLLALSEGEIAAPTTTMRQIQVGTPGGAEALATHHQLLYDEWMTGSLSGPLARIKVDEKNCFGMIEWQAVREAASRFLPKHTAAAAWKHRNVSFVEQEGLSPLPKDRGAEQGDVDGLLECSLAEVEARGSIAARQLAGTHPWIGVNDYAEEQRLRVDHAARMQESANFQLGGPESSLVLRLADQWYMDGGDIMCHPTLVLPSLQDFDVANARAGAERDPL